MFALPVELVEQYTSFLELVGQVIVESTDDDDKHGRLLAQVTNDVKRTHGGGLAWFNKPATYVPPSDAIVSRCFDHLRGTATATSMTTSVAGGGGGGDDEDEDSFVTPPDTPKSNGQSPLPPVITNRDALVRPLVVYAVLNQGISYVQGMNSLIAVLVWLFARSRDPIEAEAAAFFAFGKLVDQLRELYMPQTSHEALEKCMASFVRTLEHTDEDVLNALEDKGVEPVTFVFRWLTTMLAQDFALPDVLRLWDRLVVTLNSNELLDHLVDIAVALTLEERLVITSPYADFERTIKTLQDPQLDGAAVDGLIASAQSIREKRKLREAGVPEWRIAASKWTNEAAATLKERFAHSQSQDDNDDELVQKVPILQVEGRVLPPPPSVGDDQPATERKTSWSGWFSGRISSADATAQAQLAKQRLSVSASRLATSDAAASLSKASTNFSAQASLLSAQIASQAPERFSKIRSNVQAASSRFMASTAESQSPVRRPGSPVEPPFTPPTHYAGGGDSPGMSRRPLSPAPYTASTASTSLYDSQTSQPFAGPKPLLLSNSPVVERRPSTHVRSPSLSPTGLRTSVSVAPLGHPRSPSTTSDADFDEAPTRRRYNDGSDDASRTVVPASSFQSKPARRTSDADRLDEDVPISSLRLSTRGLSTAASEPSSPVATPVSATSAPPRLRRSAAARRRSSDYTGLGIGALPSRDGRGWSLVDKPSLSLNLSSESAVAAADDRSPLSTYNSAPPLDPVRESTVTSTDHDDDASSSEKSLPLPPRSTSRISSSATRPGVSPHQLPLFFGSSSSTALNGRRNSSNSVNSTNSTERSSSDVDSSLGRASNNNKEKRRSVSEFLIQKTRPVHKRLSSQQNTHQSRPSITDVLEEYY